MQESWLLPQDKAPHLPVLPLVALRSRKGQGCWVTALGPSLPLASDAKPPSPLAPMGPLSKKSLLGPKEGSDVSWTSLLGDT